MEEKEVGNRPIRCVGCVYWDWNRYHSYVPEKPTAIKIEVTDVDKLAEFKGRAGVETTSPLTAESTAKDWMTAWNQFWPFT